MDIVCIDETKLDAYVICMHGYIWFYTCIQKPAVSIICENPMVLDFWETFIEHVEILESNWIFFLVETLM